MNQTSRQKSRFIVPIAIIYFLSFIVPPLMLGSIRSLSALADLMVHRAPEALPSGVEIPAAKKLGSHRLSAAIVVGNAGTQLSDLMASYQVLSESGAFNVFTVALERKPSPTTGNVGILPDYAFKDAPPADLWVIPAILNFDEPGLAETLRAQASGAQKILALSEGTRLAHKAGFLRGKKATSHFISLGELSRSATETEWLEATPYLEDGNVITSPGIAHSVSATLRAVESVAGKGARALAEKNLGFIPGSAMAATEAPFSRPKLELQDWLGIFIRGGFIIFRQDIAVWLYPGVSEMGVAAALEILPRDLGSRVVSMTSQRRWIASKNGLQMMSTLPLEEAARPNLLWIPSAGGPQNSREQSPQFSGDPTLHDRFLKEWISAEKVSVQNLFSASPALAYQQSLVQMAQTPLAEASAMNFVSQVTGLQTATLEAQLPERNWTLWIRPFLVGIAGVWVARMLMQRMRTRERWIRSRPAQVAAH